MVTRNGGSIDARTLDKMVEIARNAGAVILEHYVPQAGGMNPAPTLEWKQDRSPVTAADRAAHATIVAGLEALIPETPIVSEEGWVPDAVAQRGLTRFWLVDPLDGTKEFLHGNGEFTVNIALIDGTQPVAGVVFAPVAEVTYYGAAGLGAWRHRAGVEAPVRLRSSSPRPGQPLVVVESRSHPSTELESWLAGLRVARRVAVGSSLKFCWVAEGTADVYPRFGPTMEWDVAAGDCVFRASGRDGPRWSPLQYNKPGLRNASFVIGLDPKPGEGGNP